MKVYFAADHAGFALKNVLLAHVQHVLGYEVEDCGAFELAPDDDYPEIIARAAARLSADADIGSDTRAILLGASGQGEAMVANRFSGVRCAVYYGNVSRAQKDATGEVLDMLQSTRAHNDANALSLGARFLTESEAKEAVQIWLETGFSGDKRHARRNSRLGTPFV